MIEISAHRRDSDGQDALAAAVASGADYVEIDIRRTGDGELIVHHDAVAAGLRLAGSSYAQVCRALGRRVPKVHEAMELIAGRAKGHLDLKDQGAEHETVELALDLLGAGNFVVTTRDASSIAKIKRKYPAALTALSLGRQIYPAGALQDFYPLSRVRGCGADWVAVEHRLASMGVLWQCGRARIPAMVGTVNEPARLRRFLADPRVAVLITDRPVAAVRLRSHLGPHR